MPNENRRIKKLAMLTFDEWMAKYYPDYDGLFVSEDDDRSLGELRKEYEEEKERDLRLYEKWMIREPLVSVSGGIQE